MREEDLVIDLRGMAEAPVSPFRSAVRMGVEEVQHNAEKIPRTQRIVLCCRTGTRAWHAARSLQNHGHSNMALIALGE